MPIDYNIKNRATLQTLSSDMNKSAGKAMRLEERGKKNWGPYFPNGEAK